MTAVCPCCGYDLEADAPIEIGDLVFDPRGAITWRGEPVKLTSAERIILGTLLKGGDRFTSEAVLRERTGYEGDHNTVSVWLCRVRKKFEAKGAPHSIIENQFGLGWRWAAFA